MKWPAMVRFDNSEELEFIESAQDWNTFMQTVNVDCQLILSDGTLHNVTASGQPHYTSSSTTETISVDTAIDLARRHMAAQAHCCVSKFSAPTIAAVITALLQLDD